MATDPNYMHPGQYPVWDPRSPDYDPNASPPSAGTGTGTAPPQYTGDARYMYAFFDPATNLPQQDLLLNVPFSSAYETTQGARDAMGQAAGATRALGQYGSTLGNQGAANVNNIAGMALNEANFVDPTYSTSMYGAPLTGAAAPTGYTPTAYAPPPPVDFSKIDKPTTYPGQTEPLPPKPTTLPLPPTTTQPTTPTVQNPPLTTSDPRIPPNRETLPARPTVRPAELPPAAPTAPPPSTTTAVKPSTISNAPDPRKASVNTLLGNKAATSSSTLSAPATSSAYQGRTASPSTVSTLSLPAPNLSSAKTPAASATTLPTSAKTTSPLPKVNFADVTSQVKPSQPIPVTTASTAPTLPRDTNSRSEVPPLAGMGGAVSGSTGTVTGVSPNGAGTTGLKPGPQIQQPELRGTGIQDGTTALPTPIQVGQNILKNPVDTTPTVSQTYRNAPEQAAALAALEQFEGPSAAQSQLMQGLSAARASNLSLARSGRGWGGSASALNQAVDANARMGIDAANASAGLRASENAAWRERQAANLGSSADIVMDQRQLNDAYKQFYSGLGLEAAGQAADIGFRGNEQAMQAAREQAALIQAQGQMALSSNTLDLQRAQIDSQIAQDARKLGLQYYAAHEGVAPAGIDAMALLGTLGTAVGTGVTLAALSDKRTKENIEPLDSDDALDTVRNAPGFSYDYKSDSGWDDGERHFGPMAQDLEKTPAGRSTVFEDGSGMKLVDTRKLTLVNTAALHGLTKRLDRLEHRARY